MSEHLPPYARSLGIEVSDFEDGVPVLTVGFSGNVEGRPSYLHGGAISGLLETAAYAALRAELKSQGREHRLKPINVTVQFLSAGKSKQTYAKGHIFRLGRRSANVEVVAWQDDPEKPIANAIMNILMAEPDEPKG